MSQINLFNFAIVLILCQKSDNFLDSFHISISTFHKMTRSTQPCKESILMFP